MKAPLFYEIVPFELQVIVIVLSMVLNGIPNVYLFAVISAVAVLPLFEAVEDVILHAES